MSRLVDSRRCMLFAPFYKFAGIDSAPARAFACVEAETT